VESPHPLTVTGGQIVVDGDHVDTLTSEGVQVDRERRDEGLSFTSLHFGDPPEVERHTTHELHVEVPLAQHAPRPFANDSERFDEEIIERCIYPMINEGAKILQEGKASRASDIDIVWINGYGWPVYRGGPMFFGDTVGLKKVVDSLNKLAKEMGDEWAPCELLVKTAEAGGKLSDL